MMGIVALLVGTPADAQSPGNQSWQAQWTGPATLPSGDLTGASWIWTDEAGVEVTRNAPPGIRFLRRDIDLTGNARVFSAVAVFTADNRFQLFMNGQETGPGDTWSNPSVLFP